MWLRHQQTSFSKWFWRTNGFLVLQSDLWTSQVRSQRNNVEYKIKGLRSWMLNCSSTASLLNRTLSPVISACILQAKLFRIRPICSHVLPKHTSDAYISQPSLFSDAYVTKFRLKAFLFCSEKINSLHNFFYIKKCLFCLTPVAHLIMSLAGFFFS